MSPLDSELMCYRDAHQWPEPLRRRVKADPVAGERWEKSCRVARLVSLKIYERPDTQSAARCRVAIRVALDEAVTNENRWAWTQFGYLFSGPVRYGVAAALLVLLGFHLMSNSSLPTLHTSPQTLQRAVAPVAPEEEQIAVSEERVNPALTPEIWSNFAPRVHQHGPFRLISSDQ